MVDQIKIDGARLMAMSDRLEVFLDGADLLLKKTWCIDDELERKALVGHLDDLTDFLDNFSHRHKGEMQKAVSGLKDQLAQRYVSAETAWRLWDEIQNAVHDILQDAPIPTPITPGARGDWLACAWCHFALVLSQLGEILLLLSRTNPDFARQIMDRARDNLQYGRDYLSWILED